MKKISCKKSTTGLFGLAAMIKKPTWKVFPFPRIIVDWKVLSIPEAATVIEQLFTMVLGT